MSGRESESIDENLQRRISLGLLVGALVIAGGSIISTLGGDSQPTKKDNVLTPVDSNSSKTTSTTISELVQRLMSDATADD